MLFINNEISSEIHNKKWLNLRFKMTLNSPISLTSQKDRNHILLLSLSLHFNFNHMSALRCSEDGERLGLWTVQVCPKSIRKCKKCTTRWLVVLEVAVPIGVEAGNRQFRSIVRQKYICKHILTLFNRESVTSDDWILFVEFPVKTTARTVILWSPKQIGCLFHVLLVCLWSTHRNINEVKN
jgi:hypothetical protein